MGLSENRIYSQWNSHLRGIMISKTIGFRGLAYFQTNPNGFNGWRHPTPRPHRIDRHLSEASPRQQCWQRSIWLSPQALGGRSITISPGSNGIQWIFLRWEFITGLDGIIKHGWKIQLKWSFIAEKITSWMDMFTISSKACLITGG